MVSLNRVLQNFRKKSKPCVLAFLPIILAKISAKMTLCESFVNFFRLCSVRLLIEIGFAVRK